MTICDALGIAKLPPHQYPKLLQSFSTSRLSLFLSLTSQVFFSIFPSKSCLHSQSYDSLIWFLFLFSTTASSTVSLALLRAQDIVHPLRCHAVLIRCGRNDRSLDDMIQNDASPQFDAFVRGLRSGERLLDGIRRYDVMEYLREGEGEVLTSADSSDSGGVWTQR